MKSAHRRFNFFRSLPERVDHFSVNEYGDLVHTTGVILTPDTPKEVWHSLKNCCKTVAKIKRPI